MARSKTDENVLTLPSGLVITTGVDKPPRAPGAGRKRTPTEFDDVITYLHRDVLVEQGKDPYCEIHCADAEHVDRVWADLGKAAALHNLTVYRHTDYETLTVKFSVVDKVYRTRGGSTEGDNGEVQEAE